MCWGAKNRLFDYIYFWGGKFGIFRISKIGVKENVEWIWQFDITSTRFKALNMHTVFCEVFYISGKQLFYVMKFLNAMTS